MPQTVIFWRYPHTVYNSSRRVVVTEMDNGRTSSLSIHQAVSADSGVYICIAKNSTGQIEHRVSVIVSPTTVKVGQNVSIACSVNSTLPGQRAVWSVVRGLAADSNITLNKRYTRHGSHLTISRLELSDSGRFLCRLVDGNDTELSMREVTLLVLGAPVIKPSRADLSFIITAHDNNETVLLDVILESSTPVSVVWKRNGVVLADTVHARQLSNHSFLICRVLSRDHGNYTVLAINDYGSAFFFSNATTTRIATTVPSTAGPTPAPTPASTPVHTTAPNDSSTFPPSSTDSAVGGTTRTIIIAITISVLVLCAVAAMAFICRRRRRSEILNMKEERLGPSPSNWQALLEHAHATNRDEMSNVTPLSSLPPYANTILE
ncbi:basement membrane-specific heparan sulfate proteoglycan core protein-like [Sycon ciliatum]|uniref:basement membrane-specific heparan sulfate proteoglycan core protein-like n=1 Tax=Sycon ciliatum TaxID=27933 RepID=UPI0031F6F2AF